MASAAPAPMAMPMAAAPAPAPMVVAAAPSPMAPAPAKRVSFTAESLFGFDQATLNPGGRTALDTFARDMAGTSFDVVVVQGHADRLGSKAYNQALSLHRADAVKSYLVTSAGFDPSKVNTTGKGEEDPVTKPGDCKASLHQAALRACLAPDRRVDIDVSGTR
jgi:OOP family OmpA-OmpF porin